MTPQWEEALERANTIRFARAELKRSIGRGEISAKEVLEVVPTFMASCPIAELLCAQRRWGRTRARKFLLPFAINESRSLSELTARQRDLLIDALAAKA